MDYNIVLGLTFLRQFTAQFNINNRTIALAPSKYATDGVSAITDLPPIPPVPPEPNDPRVSNNAVGTIIAIICTTLFAIIIVVVIIWYCKNRKKGDQESESIDET